jgi:hypothetical protein
MAASNKYGIDAWVLEYVIFFATRSCETKFVLAEICGRASFSN